MIARRWILGMVMPIVGVFVVGCEANPAGYTPTAVEQKLTDRVFKGEWRSGFVYQITFRGVGRSMTATVYVVDSDAAKTVYNMPARVVVNGNAVDLQFTNFDRIDKLTYSPDSDTLTGYSLVKGNRTNTLSAKGA